MFTFALHQKVRVINSSKMDSRVVVGPPPIHAVAKSEILFSHVFGANPLDENWKTLSRRKWLRVCTLIERVINSKRKETAKRKIKFLKQFHSKIPSSDNFKKTTIFCNIPLYQIKLHINIHGSLEKILSQIFFARSNVLAFGLVFRKKEKNPNNFCVFCLNVWSSVL